MFGNPYGQGHWDRPEYDELLPSEQKLSPTFGALPHYIPVSSPNIIAFLFSSKGQDILNCDVTDTNLRRSYRIRTNMTGFGRTTIKRADGDVSGVIDWELHPEVEMYGVFQKQRASEFLHIGPSERQRRMTLGDTGYIWTVKDAIYLHRSVDHGEPLVKISQLPRGILLEVTISAIQMGLLDISVLVTVLWHSGRCFD